MFAIESPRLHLRPYRADDIDALAALYGDLEVARYTRLGQLSRTQAEATLEDYLEHWRDRGFGVCAAVLKETGAYVGECGFFTIPRWGETALRYAFLRQHWGQGLAAEAAKRMIDHGLGPLSLTRIVSVVEERNVASHRIMEKLDLAVERTTQVPKATL